MALACVWGRYDYMYFRYEISYHSEFWWYDVRRQCIWKVWMHTTHVQTYQLTQNILRAYPTYFVRNALFTIFRPKITILELDFVFYVTYEWLEVFWMLQRVFKYSISACITYLHIHMVTHTHKPTFIHTFTYHDTYSTLHMYTSTQVHFYR